MKKENYTKCDDITGLKELELRIAFLGKSAS